MEFQRPRVRRRQKQIDDLASRGYEAAGVPTECVRRGGGADGLTSVRRWRSRAALSLLPRALVHAQSPCSTARHRRINDTFEVSEVSEVSDSRVTRLMY
jgi:hypothetical protein